MTDAEKQLSIHESALKAMAQATGQDMYPYLYRAAQDAHRLGIISDVEWGAMRERGGSQVLEAADAANPALIKIGRSLI